MECFFPDVPPGWSSIPVECKREPDNTDINLHPRRKRTRPLAVKEKKICGKLNSKMHAEEETPYYPCPLENHVEFKKGMCVDIITLLQVTNCNFLVRTSTGESVPVESLRGKHILLCCVFIPCPWGRMLSFFMKALSLLSFELATSNVRDYFEIVLVVKMRQRWLYDEAAFNHFVSGFSCLVIPFSESASRDFLCMTLGFVGSWKGLFLDPKGLVLQDDISYVMHVGAIAFPFTDDRIKFYKHPFILEGMFFNIEALLTCRFTIQPPEFLSKSNNEEEKMCISQLNERLVGLYLCLRGSDILEVDKVYQQCRARGLDFEIVVVYLPFRYYPPEQFYKELAELNISWWVFPFNNSVTHWLRELLSPYHGDRLIIVGPHGQFLDTYGEAVVTDVGIDAYPFTKNALIERQVRKLRQLTLGSLLDGRYVDRGSVVGERLQGRNVLLHVGWSFHNLSFLVPLMTWYDQIKAKDPDFELVFLYSKSESDDDNERLPRLSGVPWFVLECAPSHLDFMAKAFSVIDSCSGRQEMLVAFGRDGQILTTRADALLYSRGSDAFPFSDEKHLCEDVADVVDVYLRKRYVIK